MCRKIESVTNQLVKINNEFLTYICGNVKGLKKQKVLKLYYQPNNAKEMLYQPTTSKICVLVDNSVWKDFVIEEAFIKTCKEGKLSM